MEFSADGGGSWEEAELGGRFGWYGWSHEWEAGEPGEYELSCRTTDAVGNALPPEAGEVWNYGTYGINAVQRVPVVVREGGNTSTRTDRRPPATSESPLKETA